MSTKQLGFTIMELMITVALVGIISAMALPSFTGFVQRNQLSSVVRGVVGGIALTRSEAVSQRQNVDFEARGSDWDTGWQVNADGTILRESDPFPAGYTLVFANGSTKLTFNARGILSVTTNEQITIADGKGNSSNIFLPRSGSAYIR